MVSPPESSPSRTTIPHIPFPTRRLTRELLPAAAISPPPSPNTSRSPWRTSVFVNRSAPRPPATPPPPPPRRKHRSLAVLMLDLDHFKRYNDNFGHAAGDKALAAVGEALMRSVRAEDVACRYGGEEFTLVLPECSLQQATLRAEQIRTRLKEYHPLNDGQPVDSLSVSIGVAALDETTDRVDLLLNFADEALYEAKRAGRDRVVAARPASALPPMNFSGKSPAALIPTETSKSFT